MTRSVKHANKHGKMVVQKPTIIIGKKGATDLLAKEVFKQLNKRKTVKVKILKTALIEEETEEIAQKIASGTESKIIQVRGHTFILRKLKEKKYI